VFSDIKNVIAVFAVDFPNTYPQPRGILRLKLVILNTLNSQENIQVREIRVASSYTAFLTGNDLRNNPCKVVSHESVRLCVHCGVDKAFVFLGC
jgi:hypothetical protein